MEKVVPIESIDAGSEVDSEEIRALCDEAAEYLKGFSWCGGIEERFLGIGVPGLFGVFLGVAIPYIVESTSGMKTIVTWYSIILSFGISAAVGVIFGIYPASRAAAMDPIEALRRE